MNSDEETYGRKSEPSKSVPDLVHYPRRFRRYTTFKIFWQSGSRAFQARVFDSGTGSRVAHDNAAARIFVIAMAGSCFKKFGNKRSKQARKSLKFISRYLSINPAEEAFPIVAEYSGVALSFITLGTLIRRYHGRRKLTVFNRKRQKATVKFLVNRAMERLRDIAARASMLEKRISTTADPAELQRQLDEARVRRTEDAKANEKVMAMFSTQEQRWKNEQKRLKEVIETLRKELTECIRRLQVGTDTSCLQCKEKNLMISDLKGQLKEKDFLMAAAKEDGDMERSEKCELVQKLATAEKMVDRCQETLVAEAKARKAAESMVENLRAKMAAEFEVHEAAADDLKQKISAEAETRGAECDKLKEELRVQEDVLATVLARINTLKTEKSELLEKLDSAAKDNKISGVFARLRRFDVQAAQQRELHSYAEQVAELEKQVNYYQQRVQQLEECALLRLDQFDIRKDGDEECLDNTLSISPAGTIVEVFNLNAAKHLLALYIDAERARDLELSRWRKLYSAAKMAMNMVQTTNSYQEAAPNDSNIKQYIEAAKAQHTAELTGRHCHEIDSFERHMKAKDERMEGLRMHLLSLEQQIKARDSQLKHMASLLDAEAAMRKETESLIQETRQQLQTYLNKPTSRSNRRSNKEPELNVEGILEPDEAGLHGKDLQLAFVEAKIVQPQMRHEEVFQEKDQPSVRTERSTEQSESQQLTSRPRMQEASETNRSEASTSSMMETEKNNLNPNPETGLASILEKQLHEYHVLFQKINDLSAQAEKPVKTGSISPSSLLPRALELQHEVQASGNKLSAIQSISSFMAPSKDEEPSRVLKEHLAQIQKRLEMKIANLLGRFIS
ncbi:myosin-3-like isoform X3 [Selaginella moellendorffii]|uniref:myosin-3-like isoform X3 n=1 Tax=Selaginella moellendorffii TaxID=88036 RepID=UPI000D1C9A53|nr:myosin-3-like isoform X3 [Selaginella moellendorffii]|eukprot:XP_024529795.1 myosin-3-like isoform X3 [Selaginella moellendorffii]